MKSYFLDLRIGSIHYKSPEEVSKSKPFVIFLHGADPISQNTEFWKPLFEIILKYCNPIFMDRFGHGLSKKGKIDHITLDDHIESIKSLIDHVKNKYSINEVVLLGRSLGGYLVLEIIKRYPEEISGIGLIAPANSKMHIDTITH
ncbi:MAG: alpha/beta fold hydrolase, partial [Candidatus Thorarchaeota archaeon]